MPRKRILLVPVGEQKKPLYEGFRYVKFIDAVYLVCSSFTAELAKEIKNRLSDIYEIHIITTSANKIDKIIDDIITSIGDFSQTRILSNISGGTKIMSLACYILSSYTEGFSFYIFKEEDGSMKYVEVPSLRIDVSMFVKTNSKKFKILEKLSKRDYFLNKLSNELNIKPPTTNVHIYAMENAGMVRTERSGRNLLIKITSTGRLIYNLVRLKETVIGNGKNIR